MRPITVTVGGLVTAASATALRTSLSAVPGNLVLNGAQVVNGVGVLEADRNILFTITVSDAASRLLIEGVNTAGRRMSETLYVPAAFTGTILTVNQYRKVFRVNATGIIAFLSIGTSATGTSPWVSIDPWAPVPVSVQVVVGGTANYGVQVTSMDPNSPTNPVAISDVVWAPAPDAALTGTANAVGSLTSSWAYARVLLNSGTGMVTATFTQPGVVNL